ncbi:MAG: PD-(D/E)XK nuclease family protein [Sphingobacteriales bacterium JAD_PAG50586_3]|nr:MAG: PD-(D/E)XK nuclease family protein [Sphingobacteriales bacterium JAD_PAG50586_3]
MERHGAALSEVCIVVPNRRAGLFIRNIIADNATGPVWSPSIYAQDDFMAHLSNYTVADRLTQLFYFYEIYKEIEGEEAKAFAEFIHWAPTLLADFNEIDQYLADTRQLFAYLNEAKAIDLWNMGHELTDFQKKYLHFWGQMKQFYATLTSTLSAKGLAYQGMAYRKAAENLEEAEGNIGWDKVYFLGFNALTTAEEKVMKYLSKIKKAEIFWDADTFYMENPNHEAGKFLRKYREYFGEENFNWVENHLSNPEKEIEIIGVSGNAAQAKLAGQILEDLSAERGGKMAGTALVLADEGLLLPVLNSLPQNIDAINVTMGYPLKYTPVASFIDAVFSLHISSLKFSEGRKESRYYHKDIITLASHPLFSLLTGKELSATNPLNTISKRNYVFLSKSLIDDLFSNGIGNTIVFNVQREDSYVIPFVEHLLNIVITLKDKLLEVMEAEPGSELTLEYLYTYHRYLKKLITLLGENPLVADLQTLRLLFNQLISNTTIPFYGEPLRGLQVMGMLETRTLDFENIVLLSANEGVLPQGKGGHSFIPFDIKREYELPTYSDKDSIFGYHFYRLLQRAKKVWLLYSTQTDGGIGGKEKSRFITQLVNELKGPKIEQKLLEIPLGTAHDNVISFKKTPAVIEKLTQIGQGDKGFSPSALTMFIRCPLQFYFRYVAGLKENEEVEETLEAATMGTVIHKVLETLFKPYLNQLLKTEHVDTMQGLAPMVIDHVFNELLGPENYQYGKNLLIYRVSKRFVENFLSFQKQLLQDDTGKGFDTVVTNLEQPLAAPFTVAGIEIKIAGNADRIEQSGNDIRLIDYKTGKVDNAELKFTAWDDLILYPDYAKSFQLLTYALVIP